MDSNSGPLDYKAVALTTSPPPLPLTWVSCIGWVYNCFTCESCYISSINKRSTRSVSTFKKLFVNCKSFFNSAPCSADVSINSKSSSKPQHRRRRRRRRRQKRQQRQQRGRNKATKLNGRGGKQDFLKPLKLHSETSAARWLWKNAFDGFPIRRKREWEASFFCQTKGLRFQSNQEL